MESDTNEQTEKKDEEVTGWATTILNTMINNIQVYERFLLV
jgi:hypothetical protein